jgi:hypothetical protein
MNIYLMVNPLMKYLIMAKINRNEMIITNPKMV